MSSYVFVNDVEIYKLKAKDHNTKKTKLNWYVYQFSVNYDSNDAVDILDICK